MTFRFVCTLLAAGALALPAAAQTVKLRVAGNLVAGGLIQQHQEQPFVERLARTNGLPLEID